MIAVDTLVQRRPKNPALVAYDIKARCGTDELKAAAEAWCDAFSRTASGLITDLGSASGDAKHGAVFELLRLAIDAEEPLATWLALAKEDRYLWGAQRAETQFDGKLMSAVLSLWTHRGHVHTFRERLVAWGTTVDPVDAWHVSMALCEYPDIAHALIGAPVYHAPAPGACSGCAKHPRPFGDDCAPQLLLVLKRRTLKLEPHPLDAEVSSAIPADAILDEHLLASPIQRWIREGLPLPEAWRERIDHAFVGRTDRRHQAMLMLCADPAAHAHVVEALEQEIRTAEDPVAALHSLSEGCGPLVHAFAGPGWGRDTRLRKLKPIARALLDRAVWTAKDWQKLLAPLERDPKAEVDAFESQREVLAEGLLAVALDEAVEAQKRFRALDALELLRPAGNGSWARALSKIEAPETLRARARAVQRAMASVRDGSLDAELGIVDACEAFLRN